jgi:ABC-type tungstate transport system substrate-binding protein
MIYIGRFIYFLLKGKGKIEKFELFVDSSWVFSSIKINPIVVGSAEASVNHVDSHSRNKGGID